MAVASLSLPKSIHHHASRDLTPADSEEEEEEEEEEEGLFKADAVN